ncbi:universal stress protein containing UspA domain [Psychromonas ingrahamii 37]|uniref:Universal stress protein n=1 Tax=Psychromonas ingrahamii (strain DSM 17664 / CCUG 51855 / 37) TaxID=357804 RepID=A1SR82_PSYIN|nr:universal stress protein [Psychromonas ingrahamii]ABM01997.1 universal stress protein containing UspA domain [Psychromonas ingrahamii 37]
MSYKHILVAVDLSESSEKVINKAVSLAKDAKANLSLIFVDDIANIGVVTIEVAPLPSVEEREKKLKGELQELADKADYQFDNIIVVTEDLKNKLVATVKKMNIDLLVCGHHRDFWSRLLSSVRKLINSVAADLLIVNLDE